MGAPGHSTTFRVGTGEDGDDGTLEAETTCSTIERVPALLGGLLRTEPESQVNVIAAGAYRKGHPELALPPVAVASGRDGADWGAVRTGQSRRVAAPWQEAGERVLMGVLSRWSDEPTAANAPESPLVRHGGLEESIPPRSGLDGHTCARNGRLPAAGQLAADAPLASARSFASQQQAAAGMPC
ncbi:MAG: hypothetical protein SGPRY_007403 [Prymnesium sp.]